MKLVSIIILLTFCGDVPVVQQGLSIVEPSSGIRLRVINAKYPLLQILLPGQADSERGIEVEFPEHVTGTSDHTNVSEHLYLVSKEESNKRTLPSWRTEANRIIYETILNGNVKLIAAAQLDSTGVTYTYSFVNNSGISYQKFQAVTCVKLYSDFSDTLLQRTYVHHSNGFDLLASETPERLTMPLRKWLPCRYLVSYSWPVNKVRKEIAEDNITRYHKSRKADMPLIATLSHDKKWVAATYTSETGNLWTNPERSCHHADPSITLHPKAQGVLRLKTYLYKGDPERILNLIKD